MLTLSYNQITDISPLSNLTSLTFLQLAHLGITDISALNNLTNMDELYIYSNDISDISALQNLTKVTYFYLGYNEVSNIYPLVENLGLDDGDKVELYNNPLSDTTINTYIPQLEARGVLVYVSKSAETDNHNKYLIDGNFVDLKKLKDYRNDTRAEKGKIRDK